jgi:hypothetical protein
MKNRVVWGLPGLLVLVVLFAVAPSLLRASDHADPLRLREPESNITDLFFFPKGDQMILIFNVRRALLNPKPYNLEPFVYGIHMDLTSPLSFQSGEDRARYGGTVVAPDKLHADVTISVRLNNDATLRSVDFRGLTGTDRIRSYTGVREDPFTFPRFFRRNAISMVFGIPMSSFPAGQRDFILWGTTHKGDKLVDHVGRSNRSQQARFDLLNTLPPHEHVPALMKRFNSGRRVFNFFDGKREWWSKAIAAAFQYNLQIRKYDLVPDVMIYSNRFPPVFPNGRQLLDDVAALTCQTGDCILQELSFIEGDWPRATVNDKPFLDDWPYLAEPYPDMQERPPSTASLWPYVIGIVLVIAFFSWGVIELVRRLILWLWRRWRRRKEAMAT